MARTFFVEHALLPSSGIVCALNPMKNHVTCLCHDQYLCGRLSPNHSLRSLKLSTYGNMYDCMVCWALCMSVALTLTHFYVTGVKMKVTSIFSHLIVIHFVFSFSFFSFVTEANPEAYVCNNMQTLTKKNLIKYDSHTHDCRLPCMSDHDRFLVCWLQRQIAELEAKVLIKDAEMAEMRQRLIRNGTVIMPERGGG